MSCKEGVHYERNPWSLGRGQTCSLGRGPEALFEWHVLSPNRLFNMYVCAACGTWLQLQLKIAQLLEFMQKKYENSDLNAWQSCREMRNAIYKLPNRQINNHVSDINKLRYAALAFHDWQAALGKIIITSDIFGFISDCAALYTGTGSVSAAAAAHSLQLHVTSKIHLTILRGQKTFLKHHHQIS